MTRLFLGLMLPVVGLLAAAILLIRVQAYNDSDLRTFLTPLEGRIRAHCVQF